MPGPTTEAVSPVITAPLPGTLRLFWRGFAENRGAVLGLAVMIVLILLARAGRI